MTNSDLTSVRWTFVRSALVAWFTGMDNIRATGGANVLVAAASVLILACRRFNVKPQQVLEVAGRLIQNKREVDPQYIRGLDEWLEKEVS